jgi:hypothetical protein
MMKIEKTPKKLYKYCPFEVYSLRLLSEAEAFYADPRSFNDPLDCDPSIQTDTDLALLEELCLRILTDVYDRETANKKMDHEKYMSKECGDYRTDKKAEIYYVQRLRSQIKRLLDTEMAGWGVLSLSARWDCPLMWSHYADMHRGLCIEYEFENHKCMGLKEVTYKADRSIKISDLIDWKINKSAAAHRNIIDTYFYAKSRQWRYEKEWRDIQPKSGAKPSPFFKITGVHFGLRCDSSVRTSVVKLYSDFHPKIDLYDIEPQEEESRLKRQLVDCCTIEATGVRNSVPFDLRDMPDESVNG